MSRLGKTLGLVFAVLVLVLAAGVTFTIGWRPFIGPRARALTARKFGSTPARLARGEYLVRDVTNCMACHAEHDWTAHDAPILPNTLGAGQDMNFLKGLPGKVYAPNITPDPETGVGNWSDDQLARAIREGVSFEVRSPAALQKTSNCNKVGRVLVNAETGQVKCYFTSLVTRVAYPHAITMMQ